LRLGRYRLLGRAVPYLSLSTPGGIYISPSIRRRSPRKRGRASDTFRVFNLLTMQGEKKTQKRALENRRRTQRETQSRRRGGMTETRGTTGLEGGGGGEQSKGETNWLKVLESLPKKKGPEPNGKQVPSIQNKLQG